MAVDSTSSKNIICCKNVYKSYKNFFGPELRVLDGVNLCVPYGTVYSLLGPSGCGKTTLLRCILGCLSVDKGSITIQGHRIGTKKCGVPGTNVGFMPQTVSLVSEFTISENFLYYGRLALMTPKSIKCKIAELTKLFNLPPADQMLRQASGGQQRRVSFATALLHSPKLLVLDEPTVGVDPVLRQRIWNYLFSLVSSSETTVIITTHYIEEARKSNLVGLMLDGMMLTEKEPETLITELRCSSLEEAFLQLCSTDNTKMDTSEDACQKSQLENSENHKGDMLAKYHTDTEDSEGQDVPHFTQKISDKCASLLSFPNPRRTYSVFWKMVTVFRRRPELLAFTIGLPVVTMIIVCLCLGGEFYNVPVVIVNEDKGHLGSDFVSLFNSSSLSASSSYVLTDNIHTGIQMSKNDLFMALIHIQSNFTQAILDRYHLTITTPDETIANSHIKVSLDMSNYPVALNVFDEVLEMYSHFTNSSLYKMGIDPLVSGIPFEMMNVHDKFPRRGYMAGGLVCTMFFINMGLALAYIINSRIDGQIERDYIIGLTPWEIILGILLFMTFVVILDSISLLLIVQVVFQIPFEGSVFLVVFLTILQGLCGSTQGILISSVCNHERLAITVGIIALFVGIISNGFVWPLEGMYPVVQIFSLILQPHTIAVDSMRAIIVGGRSLFQHPVYASFLASIGWCSITVILSSIIIKLQI